MRMAVLSCALLLVLGQGCKGSGTDKISMSPACEKLLTCISKIAAAAFPGALQSYGVDSPCWKSPSTAAACNTSCAQGLATYLKSFPNETACTPAPDAGVPPDPNKDGGGGGGKIVPVKGTEVDIVFMVDNTGSMEQEQKNLTQNFPKLIDALKSSKFKDGLPNLRIGIVSSDVGAGNLYVDNACVTDGDKGKFQNKSQVAGCTPPKDAWIEYKDGTTNTPGSGDAVMKLKNAFSCIAQLGTDGCGFEQSIASVKKSLESTTNPGFLRKGALLAVIFLTDEDDCSAKNDQIFDPSQQGLNDPLGPLTSFRCFEFGIKCDCPGKAKCDRFTQGERKNCVPDSNSYFAALSSYASFFKNLKPAGQVIMASIQGPTNRVEIGVQGSYPTLKPSCSSSAGFAVPGVRIEALVKPFTYGKQGLISSICTSDFGPALQKIGAAIMEGLTGDK